MDAQVRMDFIAHTCCPFVISTWLENRLCRLIVREHFGPIVEVGHLVFHVLAPPKAKGSN